MALGTGTPLLQVAWEKKLAEGSRSSHSRAGRLRGAARIKCGPRFGSEAQWFYKEIMAMASICTALTDQKQVLYTWAKLLEPP